MSGCKGQVKFETKKEIFQIISLAIKCVINL